VDAAVEVSPDGHWFTYISDDAGRVQLYVTVVPNARALPQRKRSDTRAAPLSDTIVRAFRVDPANAGVTIVTL